MWLIPFWDFTYVHTWKGQWNDCQSIYDWRTRFHFFLPLCRWLNKSWGLHLWRGRICEQTPPGMGSLCRLDSLWYTAVVTGSPGLCSLACRLLRNEGSGDLSPLVLHWQRWWSRRGQRSRHLLKKRREKGVKGVEQVCKLRIWEPLSKIILNKG